MGTPIRSGSHVAPKARAITGTRRARTQASRFTLHILSNRPGIFLREIPMAFRNGFVSRRINKEFGPRFIYLDSYLRSERTVLIRAYQGDPFGNSFRQRLQKFTARIVPEDDTVFFVELT